MGHGLLVLLATVLVAAGGTAARAQATSPMATVVDPATAKFEPVANVPPCMKAAVLHGDPGKGESVILVRGTAGCAIPAHWHTPNEQLGMVAGTARITPRDGKPAVLKPGAYVYLPSKHPHAFACATACTFFVASDAAFDIHYVDAAGNEIPPGQALKLAVGPRGRKAGPVKTP